MVSDALRPSRIGVPRRPAQLPAPNSIQGLRNMLLQRVGLRLPHGRLRRVARQAHVDSITQHQSQPGEPEQDGFKDDIKRLPHEA